EKDRQRNRDPHTAFKPRRRAKVAGRDYANFLWWQPRIGSLRLYSSQATRLASTARLHFDRCLDRWMRVVANKLEVLEFEIANVLYGGIQSHPRQGSTISWKLLVGLGQGVPVKMKIAKGLNEVGRRKINNLRHHPREQRGRGITEWDTETQTCTTLI